MNKTPHNTFRPAACCQGRSLEGLAYFTHESPLAELRIPLSTVVLLCLIIHAGAWTCCMAGRWISGNEAMLLRRNLATVAQERNTHAASLRALGFEPGTGLFVGNTSHLSHDSNEERTAP